MKNSELTHYERVLSKTQQYEAEAQSFAQRAVGSGGAPELFTDFLARGKRKLPSVIRSDEEFLRAFLPFNNKALCYVHLLTQEYLRRQQNRWSFTELAKNTGYGKIVSSASVAHNDAQVVNSTGHMHFHMAAHRLAGRKVYDVSPGLAVQLKNTELRGLTTDDLRLPFPSIYLKVPPEAELQIFNLQSNWHRVVGIYLSDDIYNDGCRCWRFLVCGEPKPIKIIGDVEDDNDALIYYHVSLPEKMPLTDAVARAQEETKKDVEELEKKHHTGFTPMLERWQEIFRWAMNVVLYVSLEGAEQEEVITNERAKQLLEQIRSMPSGSKKRHRLGGQLSGMQQCRRIILGRSVVQRGSWQLTVRVLVKGHWRNQPFGPGRMYRRLQWIEPFWRGPDVAEPSTEVAPASQGAGGVVQDEPRNRAGDRSPDGDHAAETHQGTRGADSGSPGVEGQPVEEGTPEAQSQ